MTHSADRPYPVRGAAHRQPRRALAAAVLLAFAGSAAAEPVDLTQLSIEQLLDVQIVSASKFAQKASDAPASVTVITSEEIRQFGWRTLAEVLRSVRGFFTHYDRLYDYVGIRGFARPQDYNSRLLVLLDGYRTNDVIYDSAYIGTESWLDLDLVDRIEIVRGPGSSVYGGNALFGVVNIITRSAEQIAGAEVAAGYGSFNTREGRLTLGKRFESGAGIVASISGMDSTGPDLHFPEFDAPETNDGHTRGTDYDRNGRFFGRYTQGGLSVTMAASRRDKGVSNAGFGAVFGDPGNRATDATTFIDVAYYRNLAEATEVSGHVFWGDYTYRGRGIYRLSTLTGNAEDPDPVVLNLDDARGTWWGAEAKLVTTLGARHKLIAGLEYQRNYRQQQTNYNEDPPLPFMSERHHSERYGLYVQDEYAINEALRLSLGARADKVTDQDAQLSPRLGLVWKPSEQTVWKLLYGGAFRAPNVYERFYVFPGSSIANTELKPEKIKTWELGLEHYLTPQTRLFAGAYYYRMEQLIEAVPVTLDDGSEVSQYRNVAPINARGLEFEVEHQWQNGARLRASADLQRTRTAAGETLSNSPQRIARLNLSAPLPWWSLRLGVEAQAVSRRKTDLDTSVPGYGVVNLTLWRPQAKRDWELSASVLNLFDRKFADPAAPDVATPDRDRFERDGRTFRVKAVLYF